MSGVSAPSAAAITLPPPSHSLSEVESLLQGLEVVHQGDTSDSAGILKDALVAQKFLSAEDAEAEGANTFGEHSEAALLKWQAAQGFSKHDTDGVGGDQVFARILFNTNLKFGSDFVQPTGQGSTNSAAIHAAADVFKSAPATARVVLASAPAGQSVNGAVGLGSATETQIGVTALRQSFAEDIQRAQKAADLPGPKGDASRGKAVMDIQLKLRAVAATLDPASADVLNAGADSLGRTLHTVTVDDSPMRGASAGDFQKAVSDLDTKLKGLTAKAAPAVSPAAIQREIQALPAEGKFKDTLGKQLDVVDGQIETLVSKQEAIAKRIEESEAPGGKPLTDAEVTEMEKAEPMQAFGKIATDTRAFLTLQANSLAATPGMGDNHPLVKEIRAVLNNKDLSDPTVFLQNLHGVRTLLNASVDVRAAAVQAASR